MNIKTGNAWVFEDNVDTDLIYHNKYLAETDPKNMPQYAFEYYPGKEHFAKDVKPGDFVVAGKNFGCGSSREHAVYCIEYAGVPCILAETCSRIYYRNAVNNGYPVLFVKGLSAAIENGEIKDGDSLRGVNTKEDLSYCEIILRRMEERDRNPFVSGGNI